MLQFAYQFAGAVISKGTREPTVGSERRREVMQSAVWSLMQLVQVDGWLTGWLCKIIIIIIYLFTVIGLLPGGSGYFTCKQNMKLVTYKFQSGGLHEKHVVATWNLGNRLSICS